MGRAKFAETFRKFVLWFDRAAGVLSSRPPISRPPRAGRSRLAASARHWQVGHVVHSRRTLAPSATPTSALSAARRPILPTSIARWAICSASSLLCTTALGRRQGAARPLAGAHRCLALVPRADRRRGPGDAARHTRRAAPVVLGSHVLLTVVLAGDRRLLERLRSDELLPLGSRMRVRLALERATPEGAAGVPGARVALSRCRQVDDAELIALSDHPRATCVH